MFERTDNALAQKALKGNESAWLKLITRYESAIYNYGLRMAGNPHDAADLMQEIFVSVYKSLHSFRGERDESFKCWLFRIAHFRCVEMYRKRQYHSSLDESHEQTCENTDPESEAHNVKTNQELHRAMQHLPLEQKAVVELKFFGHFTFDEIAAQLSTSPNTVKSRLYSALNKLKGLLEENYV